MNCKICAVLLLFFILYAPFLKAERVRLFTPDEGLSNSHINQIYQDSKGFIWIATENGLNKFNGYDFEVYVSIPEDTTSIQSNHVMYVYEDSRDLFWVATTNGLLQYDRKHNIFSRWNMGEMDLEYRTRHARSVFEDSNNNLWISYTGNGLVRLDATTLLPFAINGNNSAIGFSTITCIFEDKHGNIWLGTDERGVFVLDQQYNVIKHLYHNPADRFSLSNNNVTSICENSDGTIWIGTMGDGINVYDEKNQSLKILKTDKTLENIVRSVLFDNNQYIWVGTDGNGIYRYDIDGNRTHFWEEASSVCDLRTAKVHRLFLDKHGNIWAALYQKGVLYISASGGYFQNIGFNPFDASKSIGRHCVTSIVEDHQGNVWAGTDGDGLYRIQPSGKIDHFSTHNSPGFMSDVVTALFQDRDHNIWVGTYLKGLFRYNQKTGRFDSHFQKTDSEAGLNANHVVDFVQDDEGYIWIGTNGGGVSVFNQKTQRFKHYLNYFDETRNQISGNWVFDLLIDSDKDIWAATSNGLNLLNKEKDIFEYYALEGSTIVGTDIMYAMREDHKGNIWVGSYFGLYRINKSIGVTKLLTTVDGLSDNMITGIEEDRDHILWISTGKGLCLYDPETGECTIFFAEDGIQSDEFRRGSHFKGKNDKMYFGGINGITTFYPSLILREKPLLNLVFTDLLINNKSYRNNQSLVLRNALDDTKQIRLKYNQRNLTFLFAALEFGMPQRVKYYTQMEKFDKQWRQISSSNRSVTYTNLNPGTYVFKVKATIDEKNILQREMQIIIKPPWWLGLPAKLLYIVLGVIALYGLYAYLTNRALKRQHALEKKREELELLVEQRTKELVIAKERAEESEKYKLAFLANMSHEIRTPLSGIVGLLQFINSEDMAPIERQEHIDIINNSATQLVRLIDDIMDIAKIEAKQLVFNPGPVYINEMMKELWVFFNTFLNSNNKGDVSLILYDKEFIDQCVIQVDSVRLRQVLNNLLSNASKFTHKGSITFGYKPINNNSYLHFFVEDTGIGIQESKQSLVFERFKQTHDIKKQSEYGGTGLGLAICKNIVEMMGGEIGLKSEEGKGTTFYFTLPYNIDQ